MDWILDEVLVNLKDAHKAIEKRIMTYSEYEDEFRGPLATDNKFEAAKHEYWRGRQLEAIESMAMIEDMIMNIFSMIDFFLDFPDLFCVCVVVIPRCESGDNF